MPNLVGKTGVIKLSTSGGAGKVAVHVNGTDELFIAWSQRELPVGTKVVIVDQLDTNSVSVEPI